VANGDTGLVANDHYHRYVSDIGLMKDLGAKAYRFSVSWTRLFPNGDKVAEPRGFAFYNKLIDELIVQGIEPVLTLFHWDLPQPLQDQGGWANREILDAFEFYATEVAKAFGDRVKRFSPINEPWVHSWLGYGMGYHAPGIADFKQAIAASHHTVVAHNRSVKAIKAVHPEALVGPVLSQTLPDVDDYTDPKQMRAAAAIDATQNLFWMDAILRGEYPELVWELYGEDLRDVVKPGDLDVVTNDWLGVNYYNNARVGHEVPADHETRFRIVDRLLGYAVEGQTSGEETDMGWPITPHGLGSLLVRWTREYGSLLPQLFITENGVAYDDVPGADSRVRDERRIKYFNDHLLSVSDAIERGANVGGFFAWSLMDNFEWAMGFGMRFGLILVDFETQERAIKDSGHWYRKVVESNGETLVRRKSFFA
jgi:beta-glucosidase